MSKRSSPLRWEEKERDRGFSSIIMDTHHPTLISFHRETIYNVTLRDEDYKNGLRKITYRLWLGFTRFTGIRVLTVNSKINVFPLFFFFSFVYFFLLFLIVINT